MLNTNSHQHHQSSSYSSPNSLSNINYRTYSRRSNQLNSSSSFNSPSSPSSNSISRDRPISWDLSRSQSSNSFLYNSITPVQQQTPFRPGFQPRGVYRDRTNDLISFRKLKQESKRLQESRLQKRLERLVDLHFPAHDPQSQLRENDTTADGRLETEGRSKHDGSALAGGGMMMMMVSQRIMDIVKSASEPERLLMINNLRAKEQEIVRWQDDQEVVCCKLCEIQFGLRVRKHHCRLCGTVVCFTPASTNQRRWRCSTMIRFERDNDVERRGRAQNEEGGKWLGGRVIELTEQEMGVQDNRPQSVLEMITSKSNHTADQRYNPHSNSNTNQPTKGVRVCRLCLAIVLRRQSMTHPPVRPDYLSLYQVLKDLSEDVERALPEFQELMFASKNPGSNLNPSPSTSTIPKTKFINMRKRLLTNLTIYDSTSKRIANLISRDNRGDDLNSSEIRMLRSISMRSTNFLRDKMSLIRSIGSIEIVEKQLVRTNSSSSSRPSSIHKIKKKGLITAKKINDNNDYNYDGGGEGDGEGKVIGKSSMESSKTELIKLNVLLEQERLVEGYLKQAEEFRRLEDANSLKISLDDL
ncbi:FYVE zinc finger-domain-containing protein [Phakopsora pachyrhizi]|uniref:FYVE zinc finger-domain-containing protein n=1 Tax=Phakopsora pachyrhizi TaxID=170000 RepID=A0AAV0BHL4_PHAPC|nr:FYVE zinc finger-domain-containing protein [Phakopsora pachyrhizi]CAH7685597.1 FYVE zinc finger-domain-containing protein [Phakopsora pachyrhizi]